MSYYAKGADSWIDRVIAQATVKGPRDNLTPEQRKALVRLLTAARAAVLLNGGTWHLRELKAAQEFAEKAFGL